MAAIATQIDSALATPDFISIKIFDETGKVLAEKKKTKLFETQIARKFSLASPETKDQKIGTIELAYTDDLILQNIKRKILIIIVSNFIKTVAVSSVLLLLFQIHIVSRILKIVEHLKKEDWSKPTDLKEIKSVWPFRNVVDEFSEMQVALTLLMMLLEKILQN